MGVEVGLGTQGLHCDGVEEVAAEDLRCVVLGCVLQGVVGLKTRGEGWEIFGEL